LTQLVGRILRQPYAKKRDWAGFVPAVRGKVMRFEVVNEEEWEKRLSEPLA